jgi:hypothetical protein
MAKYQFTFTAASLRLNDFIHVARLKLNNEEVDHIYLLGAGNSATGKRMMREYGKRLATLTPDQLRILAEGPLSDQKQIAFLAICKTYTFIREFAVEVLREKIFMFDLELKDGDFISFLRRKQESHPELDRITDNTTYKIRQVTFKILEQAGIIDSVKTRIIQRQIIDYAVLKAITDENKEWLKVLLVSDMDIKEMAE